MPTNLKNQSKKEYIIEHIRYVDRKLLTEHRNEMLLTEALDAKQLEKVMKIVARLRAIDFSVVPTIDKQIDLSVSELNKLLAKGKAGNIKTAINFMSKVITAAKNRDLSVFQTPIGKSISLATSIEAGFKNLEQIISANIKKGDVEGAKDKTLAQLTGDNAKNVAKTIIQAFTPKKGKPQFNTSRVANDIMNAKLDGLAKISQTVKDDEMSGLVDGVMAALNNKQTTSTTAPSKNTGEKTGTVPGEADKATASAAAGTPDGKIDAKKIAAAAGVDVGTIFKVADAFHRSGYSIIKK